MQTEKTVALVFLVFLFLTATVLSQEYTDEIIADESIDLLIRIGFRYVPYAFFMSAMVTVFALLYGITEKK